MIHLRGKIGKCVIQNTHTVDSKRLTNKRCLLFLWPVTLAFPLMKKHTNLQTQTRNVHKKEKSHPEWLSWRKIVSQAAEAVGKKSRKEKGKNGKHHYLSHLKFATGHYHNLKPKKTKKTHCRTERGCVMSGKKLACPWMAHTSVLYSQSILKKSRTVLANGPWVAMYSVELDTPWTQGQSLSHAGLSWNS